MKVTVKGIDELEKQHTKTWNNTPKDDQIDDSFYKLLKKWANADLQRLNRIAGRTFYVNKVDHKDGTFRYTYEILVNGVKCYDYILPEEVESVG